MTKKLNPVLILDTHRGIYFGYLKSVKETIVKLVNARHCFYYSAGPENQKGTYSLATIGPQKGSKIGPRVNLTIMDVCKIVDCTEQAVKQWESGKWE